ncbi:MAG TPA: NUDIX hydrolase [Roseiflexaceae bacterium]|nr:NUDIX hydrolase [Roseiflexaceae bacterium]
MRSRSTLKPTQIRRAAGCVVYRRNENGSPLYLLIRDPYRRWTLPKGHLEGNESDAEAAVREVLEETGVYGELEEQVSNIAYNYVYNGRSVEKRVAFFLMRAGTSKVTPQDSEGISAAGWFDSTQAISMIGYDQVRDVLARAVAILEPA